MFKRLMPRARGMAYLIRRRTAHIAIGLADAATVAASRQPGTDETDE
jgi:large subunit ribosomal protein L22